MQDQEPLKRERGPLVIAALVLLSIPVAYVLSVAPAGLFRFLLFASLVDYIAPAERSREMSARHRPVRVK